VGQMLELVELELVLLLHLPQFKEQVVEEEVFNHQVQQTEQVEQEAEAQE
tara:strand:+ start:374 stop:523 length:150 start_codon:yes stop_codon:yes gene_type:complete